MSGNLTQLRTELEQSVRTRTGRRVLDLNIEVRQDSVVLHGRANSYHVKQLAQHGVRECLPEVAVENAIEVCR